MYYSPVSLRELIQELRSGNLSLSNYIKQTLSFMKKVEPAVNSFVPEKNRKGRLLAEAKKLMKRYPDPYERPPLFGVLVGVKDIINVNKLPTLAGSKLPAKAFAGEEAKIVSILKAAGALVLGKTVCTEFAYFQPGITANPINVEHTPGGSSSGSAAAVAAGISPLTIGTQTIASVIRPAAYCGVIGFKPSSGRISNSGIFPFAQSADQVGFFTADIEGMEIVSRAVVSNWHVTGIKRKPLIAIPSSEYLNQADPSALNSFKQSRNILRNAGFEFFSYPLFENIKNINYLHGELIAAEFSRNHHDLYEKYGNLYSKHSYSLYKKGLRVSKETHNLAREQQMTMRYEISEMMSVRGIDLWITPAATRTAPSGLNSTGNPLMSLPWTFAGLPSITIPSGKERNGLPYGLQIIASYKADENLLAYARELISVVNSD